jgi:hypothetical protein
MTTMEHRRRFVPERNWSDPAQIQRGLQALEKMKDELEATESSGTEAQQKHRAGVRRVIETAARTARALARLGSGPPDEAAQRELRESADEMTVALDGASPVLPPKDIPASARLIVECLGEIPADTQRARAELVKVQMGLAGMTSRLIFGAMAGRVDSDPQRLAETLKASVERTRLCRELMKGLRQEPVDLAAVRVQAESLRATAEDLARREAE